MASDHEIARCDFCGDYEVLVAVSEATGRVVRICGPCAMWAIEQIDPVPAPKKRVKSRG